MGFGLLFIGYLLSHGFTAGANYVVSLVGIIGTIFLFVSCGKLAVYSKNFAYARIASLFLGAAYLVSGIVQLINTYPAGLSVPAFLLGFSKGAIIAIVFGFNFFMYRGVSDIANIAGVDKLSVSAVRNLVFMIIYYLDLAFAMVIKPYYPKVSGALGLMGAVIGIVWLILSIWLVLSAYMKICFEGDEDMPDSAKGK